MGARCGLGGHSGKQGNKALSGPSALCANNAQKGGRPASFSVKTKGVEGGRAVKGVERSADNSWRRKDLGFNRGGWASDSDLVPSGNCRKKDSPLHPFQYQQ